MGWLKKLRRYRAQVRAAERTTGETRAPRHKRQGSSHPVHEPWSADAGRPAWMVDGVEIMLCAGGDELEVVGESHYQESLWSVVGRTDERVRQDIYAILVPESGNEHDENAISVWTHGRKVGHLAREDAAMLRPGLLDVLGRIRKPVGLSGVVAGGGQRADGRIGNLGVWLEYDRAAFGLEPVGLAAPPAPDNLRTGLSAAVADDLADDSYDLGWLDGLPENGAKRLVELRELLEKETEPISRHYIMSELEAELYAFRDTFPTVLAEYDEIAERHDADMEVIRPALLAKFGRLPLLETYKQATIRHVKARDLERALWWAQRGLEVYGTDADKHAWVADLQKRVATIQARIDRQRRAQRGGTGTGDDGDPDAAAVSGVSINTSDATIPVPEEFICQNCGRTFTRVRTSERKPRTCPDCR